MKLREATAWAIAATCTLFAFLCLVWPPMNSVWYIDGRLIVNEAGEPIECDHCPCPTATATPTPTPTATGTPTPTGTGTPTPTSDWPGAGWYCVNDYLSDALDCSDAICIAAGCQYIGDQAEWDAYRFGECVSGPETALTTTDGVRHDTEAECVAAGCACP